MHQTTHVSWKHAFRAVAFAFVAMPLWGQEVSAGLTGRVTDPTGGAVVGAVVLSTRGGDYELHLGQDLSIGYRSSTAEAVRLYLEESLAFRVHTPEAAVHLRVG